MHEYWVMTASAAAGIINIKQRAITTYTHHRVGYGEHTPVQKKIKNVTDCTTIDREKENLFCITYDCRQDLPVACKKRENSQYFLPKATGNRLKSNLRFISCGLIVTAFM